MANSRPIPTPFIYRWRRFLQRVLPYIIFAAGLTLTMWMWNRQSQIGNAVGTVGASFVDVSAPVAGYLKPPQPLGGKWELFQTVQQDEAIGEIAIIDDRLLKAQMQTLMVEKEEILAYLPMAWVGDFIFTIGQAYWAGFCVNCPESPDTMMTDLREIAPTYYFAPPRVFETQLRFWF